MKLIITEIKLGKEKKMGLSSMLLEKWVNEEMKARIP